MIMQSGINVAHFVQLAGQTEIWMIFNLAVNGIDIQNIDIPLSQRAPSN